jgi:hypothetical protein
MRGERVAVVALSAIVAATLIGAASAQDSSSGFAEFFSPGKRGPLPVATHKSCAGRVPRLAPGDTASAIRAFSSP